MKIAKLVLISATVAALAGCEKNAPDTAAPTDGAVPTTEEPAPTDALDEGAGEEPAADEPAEEEAPADDAEGEG